MSTIIPSATNANELHKKLIEGESFKLPDIDLNNPIFTLLPDKDDPMFKPPKRLTNELLTTRKFGGEGTMDALMESVYNHLRQEYDKGRIVGDDYAKAYIALTEASMSNAVQYLISSDGSYWQAIAARMQAIGSSIGVEVAKAELAKAMLGAKNEEARFANMKMDTLNREVEYNTGEFNLNKISPSQWEMLKEQIAGQTIQNDSNKYNLSNMLPSQWDMLKKQIEGQSLSNDSASFNLKNILPSQWNMLKEQISGQEISNNTATFNLSNLMPSQWEMLKKQIKGQDISNDTGSYQLDKILPAQLILVKEQGEVQRAQTLDERSDALVVKGAVGKQKDLYSQQIEAYKRDAEYKVGKFFVDAFTVMKTVDEGLKAPTIFESAKITDVVQQMVNNVGMK